MNEVIVVGLNYSTALGVVRSLGAAGYRSRLLCVRNIVSLIAGKSRYVSKCVVSELEFNSVRNALEELRGTDEKILVIPLNDMCCKLLGEHMEAFSEHYDIPNLNGDARALVDFMNKEKQKDLALQCGMKTAKGKSYDTDAQGREAALKEVPFPCFIKPYSSAETATAKRFFAACRTQSELEEAMKNAEQGACGRILIEELLEIEEELCIYGVACGGTVYAPACVATLRGGFGNHKGVTAEGTVYPAERLGEIEGQVEEFVRRSGLTGLFCVDIIRSGGQLYFSEMNLRSGGSGYAVTEAGVNLPGMLADFVYRNTTNGPVELQREVRFLSERIEYDDFLEGFISLSDFIAHMKGDQERFIRSRDDPAPWKEFKRIMLRRYVKTKLKRMLGQKT